MWRSGYAGHDIFSPAQRPLTRVPLKTGYVNFVQRRRDEACFTLWGLGWVLAFWVGSAGVPLVSSGMSGLAWLLWVLLLGGVGLRVWAAANLEKNRFVKPAGPYILVRHPLYLGTLLISLAYFLSLGMPVMGGLLWLGLLWGVFVPVLSKEERELRVWFPGAYRRYVNRVPRLLPDLLSLKAAVRTSKFSASRVRCNFGWRALWFLVLVPGLVGLLHWLKGGGL